MQSMERLRGDLESEIKNLRTLYEHERQKVEESHQDYSALDNEKRLI